MPIGYDPAKAASNLAKHGVSFDVVAARFDWATALVRADLRASYGEVRLVALGVIGDRLYSVVFTIRRTTWIISVRKASNREIKRYATEG